MSRYIRKLSESIALLLVLIGGSAVSSSAQVDSNAIMGFETPLGWRAISRFGTTASATATRTQGNFAYSLAQPSELMALVSSPVASTAKALVGVGDAGATFEVDVMLPTQLGNPANQGFLVLFVSSPSRGLLAFVGAVRFRGLRTGTYTTMKFPIPASVGHALGGASFNDLTFAFLLSSVNITEGMYGDDAPIYSGLFTPPFPGTYLFDNLRVHSVASTSATPPAGYGTSVDLVAIGNTPAAKLFDVGIVQVPDSFHLKLGTAGSTTVQLDIGYDGTPSFTCTYAPVPIPYPNVGVKSYTIGSCTGGKQPGDLVGANWARLTIVGGDNSMKIRAQLAGNPVGDLAGSGILPPMPTWWGDFDTCAPAPVKGKIVTTSTSCAAQTAQANQIVTDYFNKLNAANAPMDWIIAPGREGARRHGDGSPHNNLTGPPPTPTDPPFSQEGHLNAGGDFDAYYQLNGTLDPQNIAGTDRNTTHFDATFATHAVLFGQDVDIVDINTVADTDSGETTPTYMKPTSTFQLHLFVFGNEVPSGGVSVNPSTGFSVDPTASGSYDLPSIQIWIFSITLGADASAELNAQGGAAVSGVDLKVVPSASVGAHMKGLIDLALASGGVDAKVNLISVSTPATAQAKWVLNTDATTCAMTLNGSTRGDLQLSSGGGKVDLVATFGICPFCDHESWNLFNWGPLASTNVNLFSADLGFSAFPLPASLCTKPLTVRIASPSQGATLTGGRGITLSGIATSPNAAFVPCNKLSWSFTGPAGATMPSATGCSPAVIFPQPTSGTASWTINLSATNTYTNGYGTITESGSATPVTVNVSSLSPGAYINVFSDGQGNQYTPFNNSISIGCVPGPFKIYGLVNGATGTTNTTFSVTPISGTGSTTVTISNSSSSTPTGTWDPHPGTLFISSESYTITMTTTANGSPFGSATMTVNFGCIP
jgi:hypothetical protein